MSTAVPNHVALPATTAPTGARPAGLPRLQVLSTHRPAERVGFGRLVQVELRKLADTLTGRILLLGGLLLTLAWVGLQAGASAWLRDKGAMTDAVGLADVARGTGAVLGTFVVLLGVLTITNEWGQRTALTTFTLEPRRGRVLLAKIAVLVLVTLALVALAFVFAAVALLVLQAMGQAVVWGVSAASVATFALSMLLSLGMGVAFALLTLNTPAAVVLYFLLPMVLSLSNALTIVWPGLAKVLPWLNPTSAMGPLATGEPMTGTAWWQLIVSHLLWIGVPAAIGTWRWLRREVR